MRAKLAHRARLSGLRWRLQSRTDEPVPTAWLLCGRVTPCSPSWRWVCRGAAGGAEAQAACARHTGRACPCRRRVRRGRACPAGGQSKPSRRKARGDHEHGGLPGCGSSRRSAPRSTLPRSLASGSARTTEVHHPVRGSCFALCSGVCSLPVPIASQRSSKPDWSNFRARALSASHFRSAWSLSRASCSRAKSASVLVRTSV